MMIPEKVDLCVRGIDGEYIFREYVGFIPRKGEYVQVGDKKYIVVGVKNEFILAPRVWVYLKEIERFPEDEVYTCI